MFTFLGTVDAAGWPQNSVLRKRLHRTELAPHSDLDNGSQSIITCCAGCSRPAPIDSRFRQSSVGVEKHPVGA